MAGRAAAAEADLAEAAVDRALAAGEAHFHALALVDTLASRGSHHLALLAVLDPVAVLEGRTRPRVVDLLAHRVAAQQRRRWRLSAYLCAPPYRAVGVCVCCVGCGAALVGRHNRIAEAGTAGPPSTLARQVPCNPVNPQVILHA